jgi:hypothetical protein
MSVYNFGFVRSLVRKNSEVLKLSKKIQLKDLEAITLCHPKTNSSQFVIHVGDDFDYRYSAQPHVKFGLVNLLRELVNLQVLRRLRDSQLLIYFVDRSNLKLYTTSKAESQIGKNRKPQQRYLFNDGRFGAIQNPDLSHEEADRSSESSHANSSV